MILFMGLPDGSLHTAQMIRQQVLICMKEMRAVHSYKTIGTDLTTLRRKPAVRAIDHLCVHSGEVPFLSFPLLDEQDWLMNCFSTRLGGVSEEGLAALNLSYTREKGGREKVDENFRRMAESAGFPAEDMVLSWQTHTTNIRVVREEDREKVLHRSGITVTLTALSQMCRDLFWSHFTVIACLCWQQIRSVM